MILVWQEKEIHFITKNLSFFINLRFKECYFTKHSNCCTCISDSLQRTKYASRMYSIKNCSHKILKIL
jgi:hypothetical protein